MSTCQQDYKTIIHILLSMLAILCVYLEWRVTQLGGDLSTPMHVTGQTVTVLLKFLPIKTT